MQYIKGTTTILADCLSWLADANPTDCHHESKGQEFVCTLFEDLPSVSKTQDCADINNTDVLDTEAHIIKNL